MTKKDLVVKIASEMNLSRNVVKTVVKKTLEGITDFLVSGDKKVELRNFGVLKVKLRKPRLGRNARTGEIIHIPEKKVVTFKPGKILKKKVENS